MKAHDPIPADWPVQPLAPDAPARDRVTCGHCGLSWDDAISTSMTPAPSARCPFENFHTRDERDIVDDRRRNLLRLFHEHPFPTREGLETLFGPGDVWDSDDLARDFIVEGFLAPFVVVRRKSDGVVGTLLFQHAPRFYFAWEEDDS